MAALQRISRRWSDFCIVAAPGPSLTVEVAEMCRGHRIVAVQDAHRRLPFADVLYGCDVTWWDVYEGVPEFRGEKWSSHDCAVRDDKRACAERYGLNLVKAADGDTFARDAALIHYGENSGFQAMNVALHMIGWCGRIALVGFDMRQVDGKRHFFGDHPPELISTRTGYQRWPAIFANAQKALPDGVEIVNCTPGSGLTCFQMMALGDALPVAA